MRTFALGYRIPEDVLERRAARIRRAAKSHRCSFCEQTILGGSYYVAEACRPSSKIDTRRLHLLCGARTGLLVHRPR